LARHRSNQFAQESNATLVVLSWKLVEEKKDVEIVVRQGANHSDSLCYREDLQRSMAAILGIFMKQTFSSGH
jgi:hypothetical protein